MIRWIGQSVLLEALALVPKESRGQCPHAVQLDSTWQLQGSVVRLQPFVWRDFMPPNSAGTTLIVKVRVFSQERRQPIRGSLRLDSAWVRQGDSVYTMYADLTECRSVKSWARAGARIGSA